MARKNAMRAKCKAYRAAGTREKNKRAKIKRHLNRIAKKQMKMQRRKEEGKIYHEIRSDRQAEACVR